MPQVPLVNKAGAVVATAIVDECDLALVSQTCWFRSVAGYACKSRRENGAMRILLMHRLILGLPELSDGREGDHVNRDKLDNRRSNLRITTRAENAQNQPRHKSNRSQYRGVQWDASSNRWQARCTLNGHRYNIGRFRDELAAAKAASAWRLTHMPFSVEAA